MRQHPPQPAAALPRCPACGRRTQSALSVSADPGCERDAIVAVREEKFVSLDELLSTLQVLDARAVLARRQVQEHVELLRERRASWREIGEALQVTRQAAWERFARANAGANETGSGGTAGEG